MNIYKLDKYNIPIVAELMARIKPEWWDIEGASNQLGTGIGWYFGHNENEPKGWVLCQDLRHYKTVEIECLGYDKGGSCIIGKELQPLIERAEQWAIERKYAVMRFTIGSRGLSCHLRELDKPWVELKALHSVDREEFDWFVSMGYVPSGILPNIYGERYHGVLLVKTLQQRGGICC